MPMYEYKAKDRAGKTVAGTMDAADERATAQALRGMGLWPMQIARAGRQAAPALTVARPASERPAADTARGASLSAASPWRAKSVRLKELVVFFRQLATVVHSGMPLSRSLDVVGEQNSAALSRIAAEASERVSQGEALSAAFARHPRVFSPLILSMVYAGEVGGLLDTSLRRIADMLERQQELNHRIRRQTFYPKLVLGAALFIVTAASIVIAAVTGSGSAALDSVVRGIAVPAAVVLVLLCLVRHWASRYAAPSRALDMVKLSLPLVGKVARQQAIARFGRAFASLYRAGVPLPEALAAAADAAGNQVIAESLKAAVPDVRQGARLSVVLGATGAFPSMVLNMLRTGEETGNIDAMLDKVADYSESEAETAIGQMTAALGSICILCVGVLVGAMVLRFYAGFFGQVVEMYGSFE